METQSVLSESKEKLKARVLVAEDSEGIKDLLLTILHMKGCEPVAVSNGVEFIRELQSKPSGYYSFGITDNSMDGGSGVDALRDIRKIEIFKNFKIIMYTGDADLSGDLRKAADDFGAIFIAKTDRKLLFSTIDYLIQKETASK